MSEINPADVTFTRRAMSGIASNEAAERPSGDDDSGKPDREGLPPAYRMRADSHYVEELTERRTARAAPGIARERHRRAADPEPAGSPRAAIDPRGERLLAELSDTLATVLSAATLLSTDPSPMARRVSVDLVRAESWRAGWMVRAQRILGGSHRGRRQTREIGAILTEVRDGFLPECRLNGFSLELRVPEWGAMVPVDEAALVTGLAGAVIWTLGLAGQVEGVTIALAAEVAGGELDTVEVSQDAVSTSAGPVHAGGFRTTHAADDFASGLGASVAKAVAEMHEADAAFLAGDGRQSTVRFTFRRDAALA